MADGAEPGDVGRDKVLAALSSVFAEAVVDERRLLDAIVEQVGDATGDAIVIRLVDEAGHFRALAAYHPDPALCARLRSATGDARPTPDDGAWRPLLRERVPIRVAAPLSFPTPDLNEEQRAFLRDAPVTHVLGVPFVARDRVLGGMQVLRCVRPEPHTDAEASLVWEVGARAALAVDNARLWDAERAARQRAEQAEVALRAELAERQRAEERLRESEEQLRLLFQNVVDYAIVLLDTDGRVVSWNAGAERMTGWPADEAVGRGFGRLGATDDTARVLAVLDRVRREGRAEVAAPAERRGGERYELHAVVTPVRGEDGALRGYAVVMRDVTLLREARLLREANALLEARTRELAAANGELEAFTYSVSHDLRAPLRAIDGFSEALLEDYGAGLDPGATAYLGRVRAAAHRMQQLIEDMLTLSRSTRGTLSRTRVDAARVARDVVAELRAGEPARAVEVTIPEEGWVEADPRLLHIVMENVLGNAWKFTRGRDPARIEVGVAPEDGGARITVRDNGAGFEGSQAGRLFQPFQRLHRTDEFEGTGIGLAIVRRILNRHGGRAWAEGEVGNGAAIHVWFPGGSGVDLPAAGGPAASQGGPSAPPPEAPA